MCGIAGIFTCKPTGNEPDIIKGMCNELVHRGPDDEGHYSDDNISLGMRRLSIIDLEGGHQPIYNEDKSVVIILNGEIYNYIELREELRAKGHVFRTNSDVEVVVHLYEEKGIEALNDLNGMFAFCLWDIKDERGFIVRDRLGIKPLYYWSNGHSMAFASELKALREYIPDVEVNKRAMMAYLQYMFIPAPMTPFINIQKLMPASYIEFSLGKVNEPREYWLVPNEVNRASLNEELESEFRELFSNSVKLRLRSDVPVGILLSGGIDSSLVTAFATKEMGGNVSTFYVDYEGTHYDESHYAQIVAELFDCSHHTVKVKVGDVIRLLPKIIWHLDEPHADSAIVSTYMVSELASKYVKVVLNGTGGDELFAGYNWYLDGGKINRVLNLIPVPLREVLFALLKRMGINRPIVLQNKFVGTTIYVYRQTKGLSGFFTNDNEGDIIDDAYLDTWGESRITGVNRLLYTDVKFYLTDDLLFILDKLTMAASIEGRVPILDHKLVEWAFQIDGNLKVHHNTLKFLLKRWLKGILPDEVMLREKMGFGAPVDEWMKNGLFDECFRLVNSRPESRGNLYWGLHGEPLKKKLTWFDPQTCFKLLCLELWYKVHIDNGDNRNLTISEM